MTIKPGNSARKQKAALHARACSLCGRCSQHHPHPLLEGTQAAEGLKRSCVWLLLDYTFKDCSEHECVHWMWNNWGIFKAPTVLLLVITPLPHHHVADIFFPVPKMLEVPCSPYLICQERRPSWKHFLSSVAVYPISTPTNHQLLVQPKQAVFKENLGARGAHSKTKAAIKYWCHKLHRLWISQSHGFLSQLKNCWRLAANYLAHWGRW